MVKLKEKFKIYKKNIEERVDFNVNIVGHSSAYDKFEWLIWGIREGIEEGKLEIVEKSFLEVFKKGRRRKKIYEFKKGKFKGAAGEDKHGIIAFLTKGDEPYFYVGGKERKSEKAVFLALPVELAGSLESILEKFKDVVDVEVERKGISKD